MALAIRLARGGAKKRPFYRIVVADTRSPRDGRFVERLGFYNPMVPPDHPERYRLDGEKAKYWLGQGAKPTDRVRRLLGQADILPARPVPEQTKKPKPKAKAQERAAEEEKRKAEMEAAREQARQEQAEKEAEAARQAAEAEEEAKRAADAEVQKEAENRGDAPAEGGEAEASGESESQDGDEKS